MSNGKLVSGINNALPSDLSLYIAISVIGQHNSSHETNICPVGLARGFSISVSVRQEYK